MKGSMEEGWKLGMAKFANSPKPMTTFRDNLQDMIGLLLRELPLLIGQLIREGPLLIGPPIGELPPLVGSALPITVPGKR
jgi:hypothetical protein